MDTKASPKAETPCLYRVREKIIETGIRRYTVTQ